LVYFELVYFGITATQINVRRSEDLLDEAKEIAGCNRYENIQDFISETIREKTYPDISNKELDLIKKLIHAAEEKNQYAREKELFRQLRKR
jgi:hypothetical protein